MPPQETASAPSPISPAVAKPNTDITARTEPHEFTRAGEDHLRILADAMPQLAWIARPDGYIYWYNQRWYEYTGTTPAEMEGWGWQAVHDKEELPRVLERWKTSIATREPFDMIFPLRGADGLFRKFLTRVIPLKDAAGEVRQWFGTNTDVDELTRVEAALRQSEARFRTICDNSPLGIIFTDGNADTYYTNAAQAKLCGLSLREQAGHGWQTAIHPDDRERVIREWKEIGLTDRPFRSERRYVHKDGRIVWVAMTAAPVRDHAGVHGYVGIVEDITERKQADAEIRALNRDLESRVVERTSELRTAVDALETEISERQRLEREILDISEREKARVGQDLHDGLCQTLAGIGCLAKVLHRTLAEDKHSSEALLAKAATIVDHLMEATNEARGLAAGLYPVNIEEYGLMAGLEKLASDTVQRFRVACKFECPTPIVLLDNRAAAHIYRITQEAVSNAIRHGSARSVVISLAAAPGSLITLKIEDDGQGLLKDIASTGMGLKTMTYRARSIGGALDFQQRPNGGIVVICTFPNQESPKA